MTEHNPPAITGAGPVGEVFPPAPRGTKAGSAEALKALHADLTAAYRQYLDAAKLKPAMLSPAMLGRIQQFLKDNEVTAEPPQADERDALQNRLDQRRRARELDGTIQSRVTLSQRPAR